MSETEPTTDVVPRRARAHADHVAEQIDRALGQGEGEREGTTVTEWGLRDENGVDYDGAQEGLRWTREQVDESAEPGDTFLRRTVTTYPDRVTDWEVVTDE